MPLENRILTVGTRLVANYKKQAYVCTVEAEGEGIAFVLADGKRFKSPSAAAVAITKVAQNGWRFWSLEGDAPTAEATAKVEAPAKAPKARAGKARKLIFKVPNQGGTPAGKQKFFCSACMAGFLVDEGETPEVCPKGHRIDDPELTAPAEAATEPAEAAE